jgi:sigma-54 dependent transcriptional regulator, acetoin dehydrogenase operon transcriptional activator AcoR
VPSSPLNPNTARSRRANDEPYRPIAAALRLPTEHLATIDESHERCATLGLSRFEQPDLSALGRADLNVVRERNLRLHAHAAPVMEMLHEQIAQTQSMVVLCDATGTIIHSIGDDDFLSRASKVALAPGINWSEQTKGTNAIGTALVAETPTLVHADEHFMHANHFLTCSAAPILDPRGNILGVLDVTGDQRSYHQHTMALVRMSARMIENHWLSDDFRHVMRVHFHSRAEFIGTLMEGILAITPDGKIVGANRSALDQLAMSGAAVRMHSLGSLLGTSVGALADHFRSPLATPLSARTADNRQWHVMARFNWPAWHGGDAAPASAAASASSALASSAPAARRHAADAMTPSAAGRAANSGSNAAPAAGLSALTTGDAQMAAIAAKVRRVIDRDIPILILGETGTGKELLARAIHQESQRARQPFVAVNCASIPDTLIESELFGYEEGAFTGARRKGAVGKIVQAHGGTLFLDEIGDMPVALQAHLLRVLQERQVVPLGSSKAVAVDVAIVCATHRNLREMIAAQTFREDLDYRLNGLAVRLPPLRERSDLAALAARIVACEAAPRPLRLSSEVAALLERCTWPGNVRQLFNVLRTACVMAADEPTIRREHLPDDFLDDLRAPAPTAAAPHATPAAAASAVAERGSAAQQTPPQAPHEAPPRSLGDIEIDAIRHALDAAGGNISEAAKRLGISRNTIYRKLRWNEARAEGSASR